MVVHGGLVAAAALAVLAGLPRLTAGSISEPWSDSAPVTAADPGAEPAALPATVPERTSPHDNIEKRSVFPGDTDSPPPEKKSIGSLARQNAFSSSLSSSESKRSLGSVARGSSSRWYSKRSLASLARGGLVGSQTLGQHPEDRDKRHIGAFARLAGFGFHGPKRTLASLMGHADEPGDGLGEHKRGLPSIARQGGYGLGEYKRGLPSIARQGGYGQPPQKRPLASIVRQGGFRNYDRRSLASLVRQGGLIGDQSSEMTSDGIKRSLSSLARQGSVFGWDGPEKRGLSSLARQGGYGMSYESKRNIGSLASQGLYGNRWDGKRNLASVARFSSFGKREPDDEESISSSDFRQSVDDDFEKRGLSSIARQGGFGRNESADKRSLSSVIRQGGFTSRGVKRSLASLVRQGGFDDGITVMPRPTRFPQYLDDLDISDEFERLPVPPGVGWDYDDGRRKRYLSALARLSPRPVSSSSYWSDRELGDRARAVRSSGEAPGAAATKPPSPDRPPPAAAGETSSTERVKPSGEPRVRHKRSLEREALVDSEEPTWDYDDESPARRIPMEVGSTVKRHLGSLVRAYMMPTGRRSGWMARYGRDLLHRPAADTSR
ncbi:uncharacterized protein LOC122365856 [Amphibalanus amphitrite]|uniref:uncharacterized protein LOC122365856 n=1 Tax=Amphibalanus amphitrite TaxID=1232801 RepID=UPI001C901F9F|nr:uncharacterized protein LOC122365856 [Amphibalanus amphitrite]